MAEIAAGRPTSRLGRLSRTRLAVAIAAMSFAGAQVLHEAGHCLVSLAFGRAPTWGVSSLVQLSGRDPLRPDEWMRYVGSDGDVSWLRLASLPTTDLEWILFHGAGPALQVFAIAIGLALAHRDTDSRLGAFGLLLALVNSIGMGVYYLLSAIRGIGSDETNLAGFLGLSPAAVAAPFALAAIVGIVLVLRAIPGVERRALALLATAVIVAEGPLIMLANGAVRDQVDAGNPLFVAVLGFSLPVLAAGLLAVALAWRTMGEDPRPS